MTTKIQARPTKHELEKAATAFKRTWREVGAILGRLDQDLASLVIVIAPDEFDQTLIDRHAVRVVAQVGNDDRHVHRLVVDALGQSKNKLEAAAKDDVVGTPAEGRSALSHVRGLEQFDPVFGVVSLRRDVLVRVAASDQDFARWDQSGHRMIHSAHRFVRNAQEDFWDAPRDLGGRHRLAHTLALWVGRIVHNASEVGMVGVRLSNRVVNVGIA